jgi:hypothetical protein
MTKLNMADVLDRFALLTGLESDEAQQYRTLCEDAAEEILRGKREDCGPEADGPLASAAAALAGYRFALIRASRGDDSFKAGDVRVEPGKADAASARGVWCESLAAASPYLRDLHFFFRRTMP